MKSGMFSLKLKISFLNKNTLNEYIKYNILGSVNFVICHIIYISLCNYFNINYKLSYTICNIISSLLSYIFNLKITFKQKNFSIKDFLKVYFSHIIEYCFNIMIVTLLIEIFKFSKLIAPIIAPTLTTPLAFILVKLSLKKT